MRLQFIPCLDVTKPSHFVICLDGVKQSCVHSKEQGKKVLAHPKFASLPPDEMMAAIDFLEKSTLPDTGMPQNPLRGIVEALFGEEFASMVAPDPEKEKARAKLQELAKRPAQVFPFMSETERLAVLVDDTGHAHVIDSQTDGIMMLRQLVREGEIMPDDFERLRTKFVAGMDLPEKSDAQRSGPATGEFVLYKGELYGDSVMFAGVRGIDGITPLTTSQEALVAILEEKCRSRIVSMGSYDTLKKQIQSSGLPVRSVPKIVKHDLGGGWEGELRYDASVLIESRLYRKGEDKK